MRSANLGVSGCIAAVLFTAATAASFCDPAYVVNSGRAWTVFPAGTGDSDNLECAFAEAVASGPGAVVKLVAGEYTLSRPIAVLYEGDLSWQGAGMNRTVINAGSDGALFPLLVKEGYFPEPGSPSVIVFHQDADGWVGADGEPLTSRLEFRGFTIRLRGLSEPWVDAFGVASQSRSIIDVTGRIDGLRNFNISRVGLTVNGVRLQGEACAAGVCGFSAWTAHNGLTVWGEAVTTLDENGAVLIEYSKPIAADTNIRSSVFERIAFAAGNSDAEQSTIEVDANRFADVGAAYFLQDAAGGEVTISRNRMQTVSYYGVITVHGLTGVFGYDAGPVPERFPTTPTALEITKNSMQCTGDYSECVVIEDYTVLDLPQDRHMLDASVRENSIRLAGGAYAGVGSFYSRGVSVIGNIITGAGGAGIYAHLGGSWEITGNLVAMRSGLPIWLAEENTGSTVNSNLVVGRGGDAAVQIDGDGNQASGNFLTCYRPNVAHFWLTAPSANNHLVVAKTDTVQDDGTDNTVTVAH